MGKENVFTMETKKDRFYLYVAIAIIAMIGFWIGFATFIDKIISH